MVSENPATAKPTIAPPPTMRIRRPRASPSRPTKGRTSTAERLKAPTARPTEMLPPPSGPSA